MPQPNCPIIATATGNVPSLSIRPKDLQAEVVRTSVNHTLSHGIEDGRRPWLIDMLEYCRYTTHKSK
jgi:hypothetical protein